MSIKDKFQQLIQLQTNATQKCSQMLNPPITQHQIKQIEALLQEPVPLVVKELYEFANGQNQQEDPVFFTDEFLSAQQIIQQLEFSNSLIPTATNLITHPELSQQIVQQIIDYYIHQAPVESLFNQQNSWYKITFTLGVNSFSGPYLYPLKDSSGKDIKIVELEQQALSKSCDLALQLHQLEKENYTWDELEFVIYNDLSYELERTTYNFDDEIPFTSTPQNAIRKKYFYYKWMPLFSDYGGNYIGIDLDPDSSGTKGQIINFGRDEEDMYVLAQNLEEFFDKLLIQAQQPNSELVQGKYHLHDILIQHL